MNAGKKLKSLRAKAVKYYRRHLVREDFPLLTALSRREMRQQGVWGIVYMLHHVAPKDASRIPTNEDLKVSPAFLERLIEQYKRVGVDFVSLDELSHLLAQGQQPARPFVAFTMDDGYQDNYTEALPVFERQEVPFAVFVATDFIDRKAILWWDSLEELLLKKETVTTSDGRSYDCQTFQQRWDAFRRLRERILKLDQGHLLEELQRLFAGYHIDWLAPIQQSAMTWEQVDELSRHPLCTIGGHTVSHPALNLLDDDAFRHEVQDGVLKIEQVTHQPVRHFAYPYGSPNEIGERECRLMEPFRFKTVFCACGGGISQQNHQHLTHLPRIYLHER